MTPVGKLALIKTFDKSELLKAMNFAIIPALIGPVLGPLVGGYMVDYLTWHWIFLINIPIGLLGIILGIKYMPNYSSKIIDCDFKEFLIANGLNITENALLSTERRAAVLRKFNDYFYFGGFPEGAELSAKRDYLTSVYQKIYLGDIATRNSV